MDGERERFSYINRGEGADLFDNSPDDPVALKGYPMDLVLPVMGPNVMQGDREKSQCTLERKAGRRKSRMQVGVKKYSGTYIASTASQIGRLIGHWYTK
jgi:hypothetical protein